MHVGIATVFAIIVTALTVVIIWTNHREASTAAKKTADQLFQQNATRVDERLGRLLSAVKATVDTASAVPSLADEPAFDGLAYPALKALIRFLDARPQIYSVAAGFDSGAFIQVSLARDADAKDAFSAMDDAYVVVRTISRDRYGKRFQYLRFLDTNHRVVGARTEVMPEYDPRERVWYKSALVAEETVFSDPFIFAALQKPGITASRRLIGGGGVITVALTLSNLGTLLEAKPVSSNAIAFVFNSKREVLVGTANPIGLDAGSNRPTSGNASNPLVKTLIGLAMPSGDPVTGALQFDNNGQTYLARVEPVGAQFGLEQFVSVAAPLSDFTEHISRMQQRNIATSIIVLLIALPAIYLIAKRVAARLAELAAEADRIRAFDFESSINKDSIFLEIHNLAHAFFSMQQAVRLFTRYVPKSLVKDIIASGNGGELGGDRREISVMFSDIAEYTRIAEATDPEDLMQRTSMYFGALGSVISRHSGVVDKYIGDAVMALWNAPHRDPKHVVNACAAAIECRDACHRLAEQWRSQNIAPFMTRFGVHCGEAVVGNIGSADRIDYTAIGATINLASRLEALNKVYGTEILISQDVVERINDRYLSRIIDRVQPVGVHHPVDIYELMAAGSGSDDQRNLCRRWDKAIALYNKRDWARATSAFEEISERFPDDLPALIFRERCERFIIHPPGADWDGVTRLTEK